MKVASYITLISPHSIVWCISQDSLKDLVQQLSFLPHHTALFGIHLRTLKEISPVAEFLTSPHGIVWCTSQDSSKKPVQQPNFLPHYTASFCVHPWALKKKNPQSCSNTQLPAQDSFENQSSSNTQLPG